MSLTQLFDYFQGQQLQQQPPAQLHQPQQQRLWTPSDNVRCTINVYKLDNKESGDKFRFVAFCLRELLFSLRSVKLSRFFYGT